MNFILNTDSLSINFANQPDHVLEALSSAIYAEQTVRFERRIENKEYAPLSDDEIDLILNNQRVDAILAYRRRISVSVREAKMIVETVKIGGIKVPID